MGAQNSNLRRCIETEFKRLSKSGSDALVLEEMLTFKLPQSHWCVDPHHLGVLFVADRAKTGRYRLQDLLDFMEMARGRSKLYQPYDFQTQMQGYCTLQLWRSISEGGADVFRNWMHNLLIENGSTTVFAIDPSRIRDKALQALRQRIADYDMAENSELYISSDSVRTLHKLLNVQDNCDMGPQEFLDLLQCTAEKMGFMELDNTEQDEWVPLAVIDELLNSVVGGISSLMSEIYRPEDLARVV